MTDSIDIFLTDCYDFFKPETYSNSFTVSLAVVLTEIGDNIAYTHRKTYYKWRNRYIKHGIDVLKDLSRRPHSIKTKVSKEIEKQYLI